MDPCLESDFVAFQSKISPIINGLGHLSTVVKFYLHLQMIICFKSRGGRLGRGRTTCRIVPLIVSIHATAI